MNILFIGDICGKPGRAAFKKTLPELKVEFDIDFVIANIENASSGRGVTEAHYRELKAAGVDVFTSGNHIWDQAEITTVADDPKEPLIVPANYPAGSPGKGVWKTEVGTSKIAVINLMGRVFMHEFMQDPFTRADELLKDLKDYLVIIDFHAEATSEKRALGFYLDGRVGAVLGTHTHVPTADEQLLPKGTAYLTDIGYCGPLHSVLGIEPDIIINNFLHRPHMPHKVAGGDAELNFVVMSAKGTKVTDIKHFRRIIEL